MCTSAESEDAPAEQAQGAAGARSGKFATCVQTNGCRQTHTAAMELWSQHHQSPFKATLRQALTGEER